MSDKWIMGLDSCMNLNELRGVDVFDYGPMREGKRFKLLGFYKSTSDGATIDEFDNRDEADAAKKWFLVMLQRRIGIVEWELGRTNEHVRIRIEIISREQADVVRPML